MNRADDKAAQYEIEVRGFVGLCDRGDSRKPYLVLTGAEWQSLLARIKRGELGRFGTRRAMRGHRP